MLKIVNNCPNFYSQGLRVIIFFFFQKDLFFFIFLTLIKMNLSLFFAARSSIYVQSIYGWTICSLKRRISGNTFEMFPSATCRFHLSSFRNCFGSLTQNRLIRLKELGTRSKEKRLTRSM